MLLLIDSKQRQLTTENTNNFTVNLQTPLSFNKCTLKYFESPLTWFNINETNNYMVLTEGAATINITIPPGYYNINRLINTISIYLNGMTSINIDYSESTGRVTFSSAINVGLVFQNSLDSVLGFNSDVSHSTLIYSHNIIQLFDPSYIKLNISGLENNIRTNNNSQFIGSYIIELKNNAKSLSFGDIVLYESNSKDDKVINLDFERVIQKFNVSLIDNNNNLLNNNNSQWLAVLEFE